MAQVHFVAASCRRRGQDVVLVVCSAGGELACPRGSLLLDASSVDLVAVEAGKVQFVASLLDFVILIRSARVAVVHSEHIVHHLPDFVFEVLAFGIGHFILVVGG